MKSLTLLGRRFFSNKIVRIKYEELVEIKNHQNLFHKISDAYGKDGLGFLIVEKVPNYLQLKTRLVPLAHKLTNLTDSALKKIERPDINYSLGWSYGKEKFSSGKADLLKGSYYACLLQDSSTNQVDTNVWPEEIPELRNSFFSLGNLIRDTGYTLLNVIDSYIKSIYPSYALNYKKIIQDSKHNTGRVLYYYSKNHLKGANNNDDENWCDWHNDHGSLTGLASAVYIDEQGNEATGLNLNKTGLYIQARNGEVTRVTFGKEDLAFQIGETLQIHSGGLLHATPHAVKVMDDIPDNIARVTFALFMEPNMDVPLITPKESRVEEIVTSEIYKVPKLQQRFKPGMTFGQFNDATYNYYYQKN